ncbi:IS110 family transposase [Acidiphilium cryptum]|uniref:IS110 family transposase n=1 Tax=Acidiphilium cryptum TaxID=524 RepID=UPI001E2F44A0|nr:IS110 family transposase [Acidiphilium cryptum]
MGRIVLATLLAEAHQALQARDYQALRTLTGVAPVTKRSGRSCRVEMRQACSGRLRTVVYHWARVATQQTPAVAAATPPSEDVATLTAAPSEPLPIACWALHASCSPTDPCSIPRRCPPIAQNQLDHWWEVPPHSRL